MLTTRSKNNKIESKKLALASAKSIVKEISKKFELTEKDKAEAVNIIAILLDSGIGIEEKMRRIGRAPAGSAFVKELKIITIKFAKNKKVLLEKYANEKEQILEGGVLGFGLKDFNKSIIKESIIDLITKKEKVINKMENKEFSKNKRKNKERIKKIKSQKFNMVRNKIVRNKRGLLSELIKSVLNKNRRQQEAKETINGLNSLKNINSSQILLQGQTKQLTYVEMLKLKQEQEDNVQEIVPSQAILSKQS